MNCNLVLTEAEGGITSPCYPQKYPNSQACKWTMQAPTGFIIQLSFLDFELEEAQGCIYDWVEVYTGSTKVKFCGLTAKWLSLNSTGNVMELSFTSDFSVQKKGFSVSFRHVAVALRNQKVSISSSVGKITKVSNSVTIPTLNQFTLCFELERNKLKQEEWIIVYHDSSNNIALSLGSTNDEMKIIINGVTCSIQSIISYNNFTYSMKPFCVTWKSLDGCIGVFFNNSYLVKPCSSTIGVLISGGGEFQLGGQKSFDGNIYNVRLWDRTMASAELSVLTCDAVGNVIDWNENYWDIPSTMANTDTMLSCSVSSSSNTPPTTTCDSTGLGCPAQQSTSITSTVSSTTTNYPTTNPTTHAQQSTSITPTVSSTTTNYPTTNPTTHAQQSTSITPTVSSTTTNYPTTNPTTHGFRSTTQQMLYCGER
ncbi:hypothetical protein PAMP_014525 [Pampus punctatissimus]